MLLPAQELLTSPCLSEGWLSTYPSFAFLFTVLTIIVLQTIDYLINARIETICEHVCAAHPPAPGAVAAPAGGAAAAPGGAAAGAAAGGAGGAACVAHKACDDADCNGRELLPHDHKKGGGDGADLEHGHADAHADAHAHEHAHEHEHEHEHAGLSGAERAARLRARSALAVSEVSIAIHSVIIGLALGVTGSDDFVPVFIAIIFHQALEGVALGAAAAEAGLRLRASTALAAAFALTTPVGAAIGIGVRATLNENSQAMLLTTGTLEAVAAGGLIFLALGDHMNAVRTHAPWLRAQSMAIKLAAFGCFFVGAAALLIIGLWA
jgi:zinc transporter ZupT